MIREIGKAAWLGIFVLAVARNTGAQNPRTITDWPAMTNDINAQSSTNYGMAFLFPPGAGMHYQNSLGLVQVPTNTFDLSSLLPTTAFGAPVYPLQIVQSDWTNGEPFTRSYLNATGGVIWTQAAPAEYSATQWVVSVYHQPGSWETNLASWYLDRSPSRQILTMTLIATDAVPAYLTAQSNAAAAAAANVNTNFVSTNNYPNMTLFVQCIPNAGGGAVGYYLHGPPDGPGTNGFSVYASTNLLLPPGIGGGWSLVQRLPHIGDPVLFFTSPSASSTVTSGSGSSSIPSFPTNTSTGSFTNSPDMGPAFCYTAALNVDTGTGILAGDRQMLYGLDPFGPNLVAGISDADLLLNYGVSPQTALNPPDGLSLAWKIANGFDPNVALDPNTVLGNGLTLAQLAAMNLPINAPVVEIDASAIDAGFRSQSDSITKMGWPQLDWNASGTNNGVKRWFLNMESDKGYTNYANPSLPEWNRIEKDEAYDAGLRNVISASETDYYVTAVSGTDSNTWWTSKLFTYAGTCAATNVGNAIVTTCCLIYTNGWVPGHMSIY